MSKRRIVRICKAVTTDRAQVGMNAVLGLLFLVMIPISLLSGLKQSVPFLVAISLWALVAGHWSAVLAAWAAKRATSTT